MKKLRNRSNIFRGLRGWPGRRDRTGKCGLHLLLPGLLLCLGAHAGEARPRLDPKKLLPGTEYAIYWPPVSAELPVYIPQDYQPSHPCPLVVFYHGLDGTPSTGLIRKLLRGKTAIVLGMEYLERGLGKRTAAQRAAYQARERRQLEGILRSLNRLVALDHDRVYLAGVSKGGWQVSFFADRGSPRVAGYLIFLAGHFPSPRAPQPKLDGIPIYVGSGENDGANPYGRMACQYYKRCGAEVTWEEYAGKEHEMDPEAPRLQAWVEVEIVLAGEERRRMCREWAVQCLRELKTVKDSLPCFLRAEAMLEDPRYHYCGRQSRKELRALAEPLQKKRSVRNYLRAKTLFNKALWQEQDARSLQDLQDALALFEEAASRYPQTIYGRRAGREAKRVRSNVEQAVARVKEREEEGEEAPRSRRPRVAPPIRVIRHH